MHEQMHTKASLASWNSALSLSIPNIRQKCNTSLHQNASLCNCYLDMLKEGHGMHRMPQTFLARLCNPKILLETSEAHMQCREMAARCLEGSRLRRTPLAAQSAQIPGSHHCSACRPRQWEAVAKSLTLPMAAEGLPSEAHAPAALAASTCRQAMGQVQDKSYC